MQKMTVLKTSGAVAAAAGLALGGATLAHANQTPSPTPSAGSPTTQTPGQQGAKGAVPGTARPGHDAQLLSGATAVKVTQAATDKEPTAKLEHVGSDPAGGYTARMVRTDGTHIVLHIDAGFAVTSDQTAPTPPPGRHGKGRPGASVAPGQQSQGQPAQPANPSPTSTPTGS